MIWKLLARFADSDAETKLKLYMPQVQKGLQNWWLKRGIWYVLPSVLGLAYQPLAAFLGRGQVTGMGWVLSLLAPLSSLSGIMLLLVWVALACQVLVCLKGYRTEQGLPTDELDRGLVLILCLRAGMPLIFVYLMFQISIVAVLEPWQLIGQAGSWSRVMLQYFVNGMSTTVDFACMGAIACSLFIAAGYSRALTVMFLLLQRTSWLASTLTWFSRSGSRLVEWNGMELWPLPFLLFVALIASLRHRIFSLVVILGVLFLLGGISQIGLHRMPGIDSPLWPPDAASTAADNALSALSSINAPTTALEAHVDLGQYSATYGESFLTFRHKGTPRYGVPAFGMVVSPLINAALLLLAISTLVSVLSRGDRSKEIAGTGENPTL